MYHHTMYHLFLFFLFFTLARGQCNSTSCPLQYFQQPPTAKTNATKVYYLGNMYNNQVDSNTLVKWAVVNLNNDTTILPDVRFELYSFSFTTQQQAILGAIAMKDLGVQSIIQNADDVYVEAVHNIALGYNLPLYAVRAIDDAFIQKQTYTMLSRVFPTSADLTEAMVALCASLGYTGALLITTKDSDQTTSAETFTEQAAKMGMDKVYTVSVPMYPGPDDYRKAVNQSIAYIAEYAIRPIVILTTTTTGPTLMEYLWEGGVYGPDLFYMFSTDMTRVVLSPTAVNPNAHSLLEGSFLIFPRDGLGVDTPQMLVEWKARNMTLYPGNANSPQSQWLPYDVPYTIAYAIEAAMQTKTFEEVTYADILRTTYNVSFEGVSGPVAYNQNRDYIAVNGFTFYQIYNSSASKYGPVSVYANGAFNITTPYVFYNLSSIPPNPGYCKFCFNGICNAQSVCVCKPGFKGEYCAESTEKDRTVVIVVPIVVFLLVVSSIAIFYYRRRREQLIKDLAMRQRSEISRSEIKLLDRIGRGASGAVYKALFRGTEVAAKSLLTSSTSADILEAFKMETAIMCALRHPNIVLFMGSCFDTTQKEMLLVMEFCSRGSLHDLLNDPKVNLSFELLLHLACQSAQGMNFLHESSPPIIHRDLKSHNILLDDKFNAKISDFGLTRFKETNKKGVDGSSRAESLGTVFWTAPEVLSGKVHTEKSDCYSFGIVLWEMWHRHDPYPMMDLVTVAMDVMNKGIRPVMNPNTPQEIQDLIRECWQQDPDRRPDFQVITTRLRALSMQHPMHTFATGHQSRIEAPTGQVFLVHSQIPMLFSLFDSMPRPTKKAFMMHNHLVRTNLELYGGYEVRIKSHGGFFVVFNNCAAAINWCVATQVGLTHLGWPEEILQSPEACEVAEGGSVIWRGLRVRMSVLQGTPESDIDGISGRMSYFGPVVEKAKSILKTASEGSIVVDSSVMDLINNKKLPLIETISSKVCDEALSDGETLYQILPSTLAARQNNHKASATIQVVAMEESNAETVLTFETSNGSPPWLIPFKNLAMRESIGKGQVGDYYRVIWNSKDVAVKVLVNQKLREEDYISLLSDVSLLSRVKHPNLLPVHGVCTKRGNISIVVDLVPNGSLKDLLARDNTLTTAQCIKLAADIAAGMHYLTSHPNPELHIHDNFKSNNIMVTNNWEVKITDFGQTNIKDLARTMTSISSVAWTAPEILNGEPITIKSAVYSFGIILWELFSRKVPYDGEHPLKVVAKILNGYRPPMPECPAGIQSLMINCWDADPELRPTWHVIVSELSHMRM